MDSTEELAKKHHTALATTTNFAVKLFQMVRDEDDSIIQFVPDGSAFEVVNPKALETRVLPRYFRHSRFQSLVRQLNFYNFKKISRERSMWIYRHEMFHRDMPELLEGLKRKTNGTAARRKAAGAESKSVHDLKALEDCGVSAHHHHHHHHHHHDAQRYPYGVAGGAGRSLSLRRASSFGSFGRGGVNVVSASSSPNSISDEDALSSEGSLAEDFTASGAALVGSKRDYDGSDGRRRVIRRVDGAVSPDLSLEAMYHDGEPIDSDDEAEELKRAGYTPSEAAEAAAKAIMDENDDDDDGRCWTFTRNDPRNKADADEDPTCTTGDESELAILELLKSKDDIGRELRAYRAALDPSVSDELDARDYPPHVLHQCITFARNFPHYIPDKTAKEEAPPAQVAVDATAPVRNGRDQGAEGPTIALEPAATSEQLQPPPAAVC